MKKLTALLFIILCISQIEAKDNHMTKNVLQMRLITENTTEKLESEVNKFLIAAKLTRADLVSIHYARGENGKSVAIAYEVNMEEK